MRTDADRAAAEGPRSLRTNESLVEDDTMSAEQDRLVRQQISSLLYSGDLVNAEAMCREHLKKRTAIMKPRRCWPM